MNDTDSRPAVVGQVDPSVGQHSPGPWSWSNNGIALYCAQVEATHCIDGVMKTCSECGHDPSECGPPVFCFANSVELAEEFEDNDVFHMPSEADKRLIESAPDLLKSLERLLASADVRDAADVGALKQARAAIAKAVGIAA